MDKDLAYYLGLLKITNAVELRKKLQSQEYTDEVRQQLGDEADALLDILQQDATNTADPDTGNTSLESLLQCFTSHPKVYHKAFAQEGVNSSKELLEVLRNTEHSEKFKKNVSSKLREEVKALLNQSLTDDVDLKSESIDELKHLFQDANLDVDKLCDILIKEGVMSPHELNVVANDKAKYEALVERIFTDTIQGDLQEIYAKTLNDATVPEDILKRLGLDGYYPEKISVQNVMEFSSGRLEKLQDIPWYFLNKMLMVDHQGRDDIIADSMKTGLKMNGNEADPGGIMDFLDEQLAQFNNDSAEGFSSSAIHPLDVLTVTFHCCSNFLRQILCEKMFMCKLSIPLVLPPFLHQPPLFLMWSLRGIVLEYSPSEETLYESSVVNYPAKIVSCLRLGNLTRSKSKFLNEILNGQNHDTFFHRDCMNGMEKQVLTNGLMEIAWYIPAAKTKARDQINTVIALINNRGDGRKQRSNRDFLQNVSNVVLVMVDIKDLGESNVVSSLKEMTSVGTQLILMLTKDPNTKLDKNSQDEIKTCVSALQSESFKKENIILSFTPNGEKNIKELKVETVAKINKSLRLCAQVYTFENLKAQAELLAFNVDENAEECISTKTMALDLVKHIDKANTEIKRSEELPLQSTPWVEWAKLNKEEHRLEKKNEDNPSEYISILNRNKLKERRKQIKCLGKPSGLLSSFLKNLQISCDKRIYYMKWLKLLLDDVSRNTIPKLQRKYTSKWDELCQLEETNAPTDSNATNGAVKLNNALESEDNPPIHNSVDKDGNPINDDTASKENDKLEDAGVLKNNTGAKPKHNKGTETVYLHENQRCDIKRKLQQDMTELESKIADSSFGLEHLVREIGQAYEAIYDLLKKGSQNIQIPKTVKNSIDKLPLIMAELLLCGYPLELMDGDASHVPVLWVKAVLKELEKLIGKKKVFVLSVLGIQSSGKSTLLNAMFGLQFSVAAGRCTRGVYAQLIPVCKDNPDIKYDYILVVDTEGLRAPELGNAKLQHDNEIATLVIGLGDMTLVNIKGENVSEMEDVLQIVVHAILKMKLVQKSLKLQPSCIFIHQNVGAQGAEQKMRSGQQKFIETLDKVTAAAGEQEDAPFYRKFKQVINLDINQNVWYFSDLWKGDPPMAPVNPGYSEKVDEVKQKLMTDDMFKRASYLTISKFSQKLEDLWKGILGQNFVFCFKNSLEMKAYSALETMLADLSWTMKARALEWLNTKRKVILSKEKEIERLEEELIRECTRTLTEEFNKSQEKFDAFFDANEEKELMEQWKANTKLKLRENFESLLRKTKKDLLYDIKIKKIQIKQQGNTRKYKEEIQSKARIFAEDLQVMEHLTTDALRAKFDDMWHQWIMEIDDSETDNLVVSERVMHVLIHEFRENTHLLYAQMEEDQLERIEKNFVVTIENHIIKRSNHWGGPIITAQGCVSELFKVVDTEIKKYGYNLAHSKEWAQMLIDWVTKKLHEMKRSSIVFRQMEWLKISMCVNACKLTCYKLYRNQNAESSKLRCVVDSKCQISETIYEPFIRALKEEFTDMPEQLDVELRESIITLRRNIRDFRIDKEHITIQKSMKETFYDYWSVNTEERYIKFATTRLDNWLETIQLHLDNTEFNAFKDEHAETLLRFLEIFLRDTEIADLKFKFTKTFKAKMAVHICQFAIPIFERSHDTFMDNTDPRRVFERNFKQTYFKMFENVYNKTKDEMAYADVLSHHLSETLEKTLVNDLTMVIADDVRNNVNEVKMKPTFLKAVLENLLEGTVDDIFAYLIDLDVSLGKWVAHFVNCYLFSDRDDQENAQNRYMEITSKGIDIYITHLCASIDTATEEITDNDVEEHGLRNWIRELQKQLIGKLPVSEDDLTSLAAPYTVADISSFTEILKKNLLVSKQELIEKFSKHNGAHLESINKKVFTIIVEECTGCSKRCPFCGAPCWRNNKDHVGIDHMVIEHYPDGCGGYLDPRGKMGIENCSVLVTHKHKTFLNEDTKTEYHLYREYKKVYPDWQIDGDPSESGSPYWKWVVAQHGSEIAKNFGGKAPDVPDGWQQITKEEARQSLERHTS